MSNAKIIIVGIGSASFGPKNLGDVFGRPALTDIELWLAEWMHQQWESGLRFHATTDIEQALPSADYVISMLESSRHALWQLDMQIPHKYGMM